MSEATPVKRKRGEHSSSAINRQRILDAALQVAHEYGYQGTTIPRVSRKANLPSGSVYWHFENKDMLFASLIEQSREWLVEFNTGRRPRPGESARDHLTRIYLNVDDSQSIAARDFWRMGVIFSVDQSVREQISREKFLDLRQYLKEEYTNWYRQTLPAELQEKAPHRAEQMAKFNMICVDGNLILGAVGDKLDGYLRMTGLSLISLAEAPPDVLP